MDGFYISASFIAFFIMLYSIFKLFVKRKEHIAMIEKLGTFDANSTNCKISLDMEDKKNPYSAVKYVGLICGLGLGFIVSAIFLMNLGVYSGDVTPYEINRSAFKSMLSVGAILFCGSLGMLIGIFAERMLNKKVE